MHSLARRYIKTAIGFLMAGLAIGAWMIVRRDLGGIPPSEYEVSAHTHALFVGFVMMMILGVALWLFPRPEKSDTRYRPALVEAAYRLLTLGTVGRTFGELLRVTQSASWIGWTIVIAGLAQIAAFVVFFNTMWSRIGGLGSTARESRGEKF